MTNQEASKIIKDGLEDMSLDFADEEQYEALTMAIKTLEQESILDKLDVIITDALDKSTDQKESQTLRWVLDMISEVSI